MEPDEISVFGEGRVIYDTVLPPTIVNTITAPTAYYKCDDNFVTTLTAVDQVTSPSTCTLTAAGSVFSEPGIIGTCADLSSSTANYLLNSSPPAKMTLGSNPFSVALWFQISTHSTTYIAQTSNPSSESGGWALISSGSSWIFRVFQGSKSHTDVSAGADDTLNAWHFLACTYDGTNINISIDGASFSFTASAPPAAATLFCLGGDGGGPSPLYVDEVGYWVGHALSFGEVTLLYNGGAGMTWSPGTGWVT